MNAYFVYDFYYSVSNSTKTESAVMTYARDNYMYWLISERALDAVVNDLKAYMIGIMDENKRLKPIDISLSNELYEFEGNRSIYIGGNSLKLRKVKDTLLVKSEDLR